MVLEDVPYSHIPLQTKVIKLDTDKFKISFVKLKPTWFNINEAATSGRRSILNASIRCFLTSSSSPTTVLDFCCIWVNLSKQRKRTLHRTSIMSISCVLCETQQTRPNHILSMMFLRIRLDEKQTLFLGQIRFAFNVITQDTDLYIVITTTIYLSFRLMPVFLTSKLFFLVDDIAEDHSKYFYK